MNAPDRRTSDRRVSPAIGEHAIQEARRLRAINAELLAALRSCEREMAYAGWGGEGKQGALVVRINTLKLARAAILKAQS